MNLQQGSSLGEELGDTSLTSIALGLLTHWEFRRVITADGLLGNAVWMLVLVTATCFIVPQAALFPQPDWLVSPLVLTILYRFLFFCKQIAIYT